MSIVRQIVTDRVCQTGSAKDLDSDAFERLAIAAMAQKLGPRGKLVIKDTALTAIELRLIAMGQKYAPIDRNELALLCDDLATKLGDIKNQVVTPDDGFEYNAGYERGPKNTGVLNVTLGGALPTPPPPTPPAPVVQKDPAQLLAEKYPRGLPASLVGKEEIVKAVLTGKTTAANAPKDLLTNPDFVGLLVALQPSLIDTFDKRLITNVETWIAAADRGFTTFKGTMQADLRALSTDERTKLSAELFAAGVTHLDRFDNLATVRRLLDDLTKPSDKPLAVLIYPRHDWNGAFTGWVDISELQKTHRVVYREADTDREFEAEAGKDYGAQADLLVVGGHGWELGTNFGSGTRAPGSGDLDHSDMSRMKRLGLDKRLKPGAHVVLFSCSTGRGRDKHANIANLLSQIYPGQFIHAPTFPAGPTISVKDGKIDGVKFMGEAGYVIPPSEGR